MRLYIYEHCPFCLRARMIAGFKNLAIQYSVIMEGDEETPIKLVGKKTLPILQRADGQYMTESLDIVSYLDDWSDPKYAVNHVDEAIGAWAKEHSDTIVKLIVPRFTQSDFKEISTLEARQAFVARETQAFGPLTALLDQTPEYIAQINPALEQLDPLLAAHTDIDKTDFIIFPLLRSLSIVKDAVFGAETKRYMNRIATAAKVDLLTDQAI
ncbi:glutaredoxin 2 [Acinetobacter apis]|uniref:Glutaredoxin 2 n=1 Tax=Acinetobacter apis TaxID=1229165 RepID=A0A217EDG8_9GAMM|nr:glutaredoxin 2 [Acinetobacter apis]SNQ28357.1 glutaredoxin 2 [Acinetobacter apis]